MYVRDKRRAMASDSTGDLPDSLETLLSQHDPETLAAIRERCDALLGEYDLEEEIDEQTYG
jgi:hypothetical protein